MKVLISMVAGLLLSAPAIAQTGDVAFWIPNGEGTSAEQAQIVRNGEYFSVRLHSVFAYYQSGFFENITSLVIASNLTVHEAGRVIEGATINKIWQKTGPDGDFIAINDHLAVLSPATPLSIKIKVRFRGIGEDRYRRIFEVLGSSAFKTAVSMSPTTLGRLSALTPLIERFLASPYTSDSPRQILDVEQSFVLYPEGSDAKPDGLREGYYILISGRENSGDDLRKLLGLNPEDVRLSPLGSGVQYREGGEWRPVNRNSYAVVSVTKVPVRGEDETSPWFRKYNEAIASAEKVSLGVPAANAKDEAMSLWREAGALLAADANYIQSERDAIRFERLGKIKKIIEAKDGRFRINVKAYGVPDNFETIAARYRVQVASQRSNLVVKVMDSKGRALRNKGFTIVGVDKHEPLRYLRTSDFQGNLVFSDMRPGVYKLAPVGSPQEALTDIATGIHVVLEPRKTKSLRVLSGGSHWSWGSVVDENVHDLNIQPMVPRDLNKPMVPSTPERQGSSSDTRLPDATSNPKLER